MGSLSSPAHGPHCGPSSFAVNELPPCDRVSNIILGGLSFGKVQPNMPVSLDKFVDEICNVGPLTWTCNSEVITSNVYVLCCCADAPATIPVQNHTKHGGYHSCSFCLIKGEYAEGAVRFPWCTPEPPLRTHQLVERDMRLVVHPAIGHPVNVVKGPSPLLKLPNFDMVQGQSVEYMHSLLLGVSRQLGDYWFLSPNSGQPYYIGEPSTLVMIDERLLSIRPPHCAKRLPRSLKERGDWKASEHRSWLLFYCLLCTRGYLPLQYWRHMVILVEAAATLLASELNPSMISQAG